MKHLGAPLLAIVTVLVPRIVLAAEPLTVCDLLGHLNRYKDKIIAVRGELRTGSEEVALYATDCSTRVTTNGHRWLNAIWLTPPDGLPERLVGFALDEVAMAKFNRDLGNVRTNDLASAPVFVTVIGKCETRTRFVGGPGPNGTWIGNGFGHLNAYPAQLVFMRMETPAVRK
jgi:hypothetical protein